MQMRSRFQLLREGLCSIALLALLLLLAACQDNGGPPNAASTPTPTPSPTFTPTPTPSPTPIVTSLKTYSGTGYTIGYPKGWNASVGSDNIVSFTDPTGLMSLTITVKQNTQGATAPSDLVDMGLQVFHSQASNYQQVSIASTTSVGKEIWSQGAATGDVTITGQVAPVTMQEVVIANNHPPASPTTKAFTIAYSAELQDFSLINQGYFQPMLRSFTFTS